MHHHHQQTSIDAYTFLYIICELGICSSRHSRASYRQSSAVKCTAAAAVGEGPLRVQYSYSQNSSSTTKLNDDEHGRLVSVPYRTARLSFHPIRILTYILTSRYDFSGPPASDASRCSGASSRASTPELCGPNSRGAPRYGTQSFCLNRNCDAKFGSGRQQATSISDTGG